MSKLAEYRQLEKHLAEQLEALEALKGDAGLKKEIEFETKLRDLLAKYGFSLKDVVNLLDPKSARRGAGAAATADATKAGTRRAREVKIYEHPQTGERVETKGGNHKILKQWKSEHGSATVESWLKK
ncbi:histone-like nucleoid-structuring protein, MvaT/MvaU family [Pseudomonas sp. T8]|uniref:histone-like nucleoid-structuring protein, MvaT/MvaU family n=1 Tax=Pseudomonas sp. T8 TaxID=645292 RepID=UPI00214956A1|nr:histone-like nucleoid-structuring protein, MvaT/MvaU family [Pseudomonas sp. T8]UUT22936.1 DNA binding protein [Pseudomonas sp. T8]